MKDNIITKIPLTIYRRLRWRKHQLKSYKHLLGIYGKEYAQICYNAEKAIYRDEAREEICSLLKKKDDIVFAHIEEKCSKTLALYQQPCKKENVRCSSLPGQKNIWVFWWSGEDQAPPIVKACIKSIRNNANGHDVVILDRDNFSRYVTLPELILEKHSQGIISHAHFSDILRMALLEKYGGAWIDATVFISQPLPETLFTAELYTAKSVNNFAYYISRSRWTGYFWCGKHDFPLWHFVKDMLIEYWEHSDDIIDYLLMDYVIEIAYQKIPVIRHALDMLPDNNLLRGDLMRRINEPYSQELFSVLETGETFLSKLSWRYGNPKTTTQVGEQTNYGYLLEK